MRTATILCLVLTALVGCRASTGDPQCVMDGAGDAIRSSNELQQTQAHVAPGTAISREGDAVAPSTRLGVDVQGAAQAAPNPVTIASLVGGSAAKVLSTETPEEKAVGVRLARVQAALKTAEEDRSIAADDAARAVIDARIAGLERTEAEQIERLTAIYTRKWEHAAELVPDVSNLRQVYYMINANQVTTSGKALSDRQSEVTAAAFMSFMKQANPEELARMLEESRANDDDDTTDEGDGS